MDALKINEMYSHEKEAKKTGAKKEAPTEEEGTANLLNKKWDEEKEWRTFDNFNYLVQTNFYGIFGAMKSI